MILFEALTWFGFGAFLALLLLYVQRTANPMQRAIVVSAGAVGGLLGGYASDLALPRLWNVHSYTAGSLLMAGLFGLMACAVAWLMTTRERIA